MSPAIFDESGKQLWPNEQAVQGVDTNLVNETGIAQFFSRSDQVPEQRYSRIIRVSATTTRPPANAPNSSFHELAVVGATAAAQIRGVGLNCQVIFLTSR